MCGFLSRGPHWGPGLQPSVCPDWESNRQPFCSQPMLNPLSHMSQGPKMSFVCFRTSCQQYHPAHTLHVWVLFLNLMLVGFTRMVQSCYLLLPLCKSSAVCGPVDGNSGRLHCSALTGSAAGDLQVHVSGAFAHVCVGSAPRSGTAGSYARCFPRRCPSSPPHQRVSESQWLHVPTNT